MVWRFFSFSSVSWFLLFSSNSDLFLFPIWEFSLGQKSDNFKKYRFSATSSCLQRKFLFDHFNKLSVSNYPNKLSFSKIGQCPTTFSSVCQVWETMTTPTDRSHPFSRLVWPKVVNLLIFRVYVTHSKKLRSIKSRKTVKSRRGPP